MDVAPGDELSYLTMTDDELLHQLRAARPAVDFPAHFQRETWSRIEAAELSSAAGSPGFWGTLLQWVARPVPAMAAVAVMIGGGCLLAVLAGKAHHRQMAEAGYLRSISPFAAARLHPQP